MIYTLLNVGVQVLRTWLGLILSWLFTSWVWKVWQYQRCPQTAGKLSTSWALRCLFQSY